MPSSPSSDDPILRFFSPLGNAVEGEEPEDHGTDEEPSWERLGKVYNVGGRDMVLYPIGALAEALERRPVTIRTWEQNRWLPETPVRGKQQHRGRRRLYTRSMIEGLLQIAQEEGLMVSPGTRPPKMEDTRFTQRAEELFARIKEEEL